MTFGILKSKIENILLESYSKGVLKNELKNFKKYVLENKNISKIYFLYDDLSSNKGMDNTLVFDYINECITVYENTVNKINDSDILNLKKWVKESKVENNYKVIDDLFSSGVTLIESKLESRRVISETLKQKPKIKIDSPLIPLNSMVNIANKTINNYINNLNESDKKELLTLLSEDVTKLNQDYNIIKEDVLNKLTVLKEESTDQNTKESIVKTINKINEEKYDKVNYIKLKNLNNSI
jgi:hypothetical protein